MKYTLLLLAVLVLAGCSTAKPQLVQQKPAGLRPISMHVVSSELIETNGMKRMVTTMSDGSVRVYPE